MFIFIVVRWACGVIMFTLLVGCPPFWHRKQMVMLRNIMEGKYSFTSPEWADISGTYILLRVATVCIQMHQLKLNRTFIFFSLVCVCAEDPKDLIRKCLVVEPENRITVKEALKHPFFNTTVSVNFVSVIFFLQNYSI